MALGKDEREVGTCSWCTLVCLAGRRLMYKQNVFRVLGLSFRDTQFCTGVSARKKYVVTSFILACLFVFYELISYSGKLCLFCTETSALHLTTKTIH